MHMLDGCAGALLAPQDSSKQMAQRGDAGPQPEQQNELASALAACRAFFAGMALPASCKTYALTLGSVFDLGKCILQVQSFCRQAAFSKGVDDLPDCAGSKDICRLLASWVSLDSAEGAVARNALQGILQDAASARLWSEAGCHVPEATMQQSHQRHWCAPTPTLAV